MEGLDNIRNLGAMLLSASFRIVSHFCVVEVKNGRRSGVEVEGVDGLYPTFQKRLITSLS
jgi:hypothetical protein